MVAQDRVDGGESDGPYYQEVIDGTGAAISICSLSSRGTSHSQEMQEVSPQPVCLLQGREVRGQQDSWESLRAWESEGSSKSFFFLYVLWIWAPGSSVKR
ncbi:hypothetical protein KI387_041048, partial [Taxus chinensis]